MGTSIFTDIHEFPILDAFILKKKKWIAGSLISGHLRLLGLLFLYSVPPVHEEQQSDTVYEHYWPTHGCILEKSQVSTH